MRDQLSPSPLVLFGNLPNGVLYQNTVLLRFYQRLRYPDSQVFLKQTGPRMKDYNGRCLTPDQLHCLSHGPIKYDPVRVLRETVPRPRRGSITFMMATGYAYDQQHGWQPGQIHT